MLEIKQVTKSYGSFQALQDINLTLTEGIYALLGPNGAGKSTLMKLVTRQLKMDTGTILWNGEQIQAMGVRYFDILGYAPQQQGYYDEFSGQRFLTYIALLKNIDRHDIPEEVERVAGLVHMKEHLHKKCKTYSGGMKQRLLVAQALLGQPKLLLFDEPSAGLDPKERVALRSIFADLSQDHILVIATHVVSDISTIAKEVIFLKQGHVIKQGTLETLLQDDTKTTSLEALYMDLFAQERSE